MKKKIRSFIPYMIAFAVDFYVLPFVIKDTGSAMFMMLCVIPLLAFICAVIYGVRQGFDFLLPLAAIVLFAPTVFIFYNPSAWPYVLIYGAITLAGAGVGRIFYGKR